MSKMKILNYIVFFISMERSIYFMSELRKNDVHDLFMLLICTVFLIVNVYEIRKK